MKRAHVVGLLALTLALAVGLIAWPAVAQNEGSKSAKDGGANVAEDAGPEPELSSEVRITIRTEPEVRAEVRWGKKMLGRTPLDFYRPRDSGPMDLVITAPGYLTVRTRAYTFDRDKMFVRMTKIKDSHMIFGYRKPVPDAGVPDAGAPRDGGTGGPAPTGGTQAGPGAGAVQLPTGGTQAAPGAGGTQVPTGGTKAPAGSAPTPTGSGKPPASGGKDGGTGN